MQTGMQTPSGKSYAADKVRFIGMKKMQSRFIGASHGVPEPNRRFSSGIPETGRSNDEKGRKEMTPHHNYLLLKQQLLQKQQAIQSMLRPLDGASEDDGKIQMVETRLYVGLNDAATKKQMFETEQYTQQLKQLCFSYHVPFSVGIEEGGYFHESGEYVEEKTLVLTLIDAEKDTVRKIAKDLCTLFHQESVLITEDDVKGCYIM